MTASQTTTGGLVRLRHQHDHFLAERVERHPWGVTAYGQFRHALWDGWHYYPHEAKTYSWPWKQIVEIREEAA